MSPTYSGGTLSVSPEAEKGSQDAPVQRRSSKACEACRVRRIKCVGPPPCESCRAAGLGSSCTVRLKARPKRAPSAKLLQRLQRTRPAEPALPPPNLTQRLGLGSTFPIIPEDTDPAAGPSSSAMPWGPATGNSTSSTYDRRNPLDDVEAALAAWCATKNVPFSKLVFKVEARLAGFPVTPLPAEPEKSQVEDLLFNTLISAKQFDDLTNDWTFLRSLYGRYRAVPNSLSDDQKALVYAMLCIARFYQIRQSRDDGLPMGSLGIPRDDVTYYNMSTEALARWNRPSLYSAWAYFYLVPFTIGMGGPGESKHMLQQFAWHVKELGLHKRATADLYQPHERAHEIFAAYFYSEMFRSSLTDLTPALSLIEVDVDPTPPPTMFPPCLNHACMFTAKVLADFGDSAVDMTTNAYVTQTEALWMPYLRDLRQPGQQEGTRAKNGWAQFRYNWLRMLLYIPLMVSTTQAPQAYGMIARSIQQSLETYADLALNQLNPSWPQVQRLAVCGQLLILCHEAGEFHPREAKALFQMIVDMLRRYQDTWPACADLIVGLTVAAKAFDIDIVADSDFLALSDGALPTEALMFEDYPYGPYGMVLDFDFSAFPPCLGT